MILGIGLAVVALAACALARRRAASKGGAAIPDPFPWWDDLALDVYLTGKFPSEIGALLGRGLRLQLRFGCAGLDWVTM
jgi:hypothetical protein